MDVIIAGTRDFDDYDLLAWVMDTELLIDIDQVVCGMARGADELGAKWAKENDIPVAEYPADWDKFGKSAGYRRNEEMAENADACIAFWDGESRGTKHMIDLALEHGLDLHVIRYDLR